MGFGFQPCSLLRSKQNEFKMARPEKYFVKQALCVRGGHWLGGSGSRKDMGFVITWTQVLTAATLGGSHLGVSLGYHKPKDKTPCLLEDRGRARAQEANLLPSPSQRRPLLSFVLGFGHRSCSWHLCFLAASAACHLTQAAVLAAGCPSFSFLGLC